MEVAETPTKGKLAGILEELEERAHVDGVPAYRELFRGLNIRIQELDTGWQVAIAREWPSVPKLPHAMLPTVTTPAPVPTKISPISYRSTRSACRVLPSGKATTAVLT